MEVITGEVPDEVCPGLTSDICAKLGYLSEQIVPSINAVNGGPCDKFKAPSNKLKLVLPNQGTAVE